MRSLPEILRGLLFVGLSFLAIPVACAGYIAIPEVVFDDTTVVSRADLATWERLPDPPAQLVEIVQAGFADVYGRDSAGRFWRCTIASEVDRACWISIAGSPPETLVCSIEDQLKSPETIIAGRFTAEAVVDWDQATYCDFGLGGKAIISQYVYVLTGKGEVWRWGFDRAGVVSRPVYWAVKLGVGATAGLAVLGGIGLIMLVLYRARWESSPPAGR